MNRTLSSIFLASLMVFGGALLPGCGGDTSEPRPMAAEGADAGVDPFACSADQGLELLVLQDFEKGIATDFYTNADGTSGSEVTPPVGSTSPAAVDIPGGRCGVSSRSFQMTGSGLATWGMVFGFNFRGGAQDLSDWEGIAFWARKGSAESGTSLFFSVFDPLTESSGDKCDSESEVLEEKCDPYGTGVGLNEEWRFFAISFEKLRQRGFGVATDELVVEEILGLNWAMEVGDWDVWVDDISLYRPEVGGAGDAGASED